MAVDEQLEEHLNARRDDEEDSSGAATSQVSVAWLAAAFHMNQATIREKLRDCPTVVNVARGTKYRTVRYDLRTAAAFLVTPHLTSEQYMRAAKRGSLPAGLQQTIWDALLKRQKWEENAGQLWRTEKVRERLGSTFQTIKFTMQLWVDTLERQTGVTREQRTLLIGMVDQLQAEIYQSLVGEAEKSRTGPQVTEIADLVGESTPVVAMIDEDEEREIEAVV